MPRRAAASLRGVTSYRFYLRYLIELLVGDGSQEVLVRRQEMMPPS
jgi:hypothetical protein